MSNFGLPGLSLIGTALGYLIASPSANRNIGGIVADVTVEEDHYDETVVTEHPVEQGAAIADHAFQRPAQLTVRAGWTNSGTGAISLLGVTGAAGVISALSGANRVNDIYAQLRQMQKSFTLITVVTGKRTYQNMLIQSIAVTTDVGHENAMVAIIRLKELILVSTQTVNIASTANMDDPLDNGAVQNQGTQQLVPATNYNSSNDADMGINDLL